MKIILFLILIICLINHSFSQDLIKGKYCELNVLECHDEYEFNGQLFNWYGECDTGPIYGQGTFNLNQKRSILILQFNNYKNKQKQSEICPTYYKTDDSLLHLKFIAHCSDNSKEWLYTNCAIHSNGKIIGKSFYNDTVKFDLKNEKIDSIKLSLIGFCPIIYIPDFSSNNNLVFNFTLFPCNAKYIENSIDTLFIKSIKSDLIILKRTKDEDKYYYYGRIEERLRNEKKIMK